MSLSYTDFGKTAPAARAALTALSKAAADTGLDKTITELVKLRVSQINGCAFCIAFHLKMLRAQGVTQDRLDLLTVWHETALFSPAERAALAWAEDMTQLEGLHEDGAAALAAHFSETEILGLNLAIAGINAWNRLGIAFGFSPADAG